MQAAEPTWAVIQTFFKRELDLSEFLRQRGVPHFIPMHYREKTGADGQSHRVLVPIIHNYTFVQNVQPLAELRAQLAESPVPLRLLRNRETGAVSEISNREMFEFRTLCDPQFSADMVVTDEPVDTTLGKEVEVVLGPFRGIRGRLVRKQKKYWFIKTIADISVMLRITRWYCRPL